MKKLILISTISLLFFSNSIAQNGNFINRKNPSNKPLIILPVIQQESKPVKLPDRNNYPPAPKENWEAKPQFTVDPNYKPNYWHTLEHTVNDTLFWNNVQKNRMIIMIGDGYAEKDILPFLELHNLTNIVKRSLFPEIMNFIVVDVSNTSPISILNIVKDAKLTESIKCAEPDGIGTSLSCLPNDPFYLPNQWGPYQIWADSAWCYVSGNSGQWVAVLDNAVDWFHPDLYDNVWFGYDYADNDNDPTPASPSDNHGTHVTGTVAATINNGTGIAGMINDTVYFAKIFSDGSPTLSLSDLISALNAISGSSKINVLNMSVGGPVYNASLDAACLNNWNSGQLLIAASGNNSTSPVLYPAGYNSVVAVGSIQSSYALSSFSNFGSQQEVVAPGGDGSAGSGDILSTLPSSNYGFMAGTSMASPHVTGLGALLFAANPCMTNVAARQILQQNVVDLGSAGWDSNFGYGLIQAHTAVIAALPPSASITSSINVTCNGGNNGIATVSVSYGFPPFTYLWSSGSTSTTATNLVAGMNTVTVTDALGCTSVTNVFLTQPAPVPANAGSNSSICLGANTNLNASGGVSYNWSPSTGLNNPNISNPVATPTTTTNYTVTVTDGNGCSANDAVLITVNPLPNVNAGTDVSICSGNNTNLSASGGVSYSWSPTTALSNPNISNPVASPSTTTNYTVTVTDGNGCVNSDGITITVNQLPTASNVTGSALPCENTSQTYTATSTGATSYSWNLPAGWTGSSTTNTILATVGSGSGSVCATPINSCGNGTQGCQSATVSLLPTTASVSGNATPNQGASETYTATSTGATSYIWSLPAGWTGSSTTSTINVTVGSISGNVCATPVNSCGNGTQDCQAISIITGIDEIPDLNELSIYPNPTSGNFTIELTTILEKDFELKIFDVEGRLLHQEKLITKQGTTQSLINTKGWASGIYNIQLSNEDGHINKKVIVN